jgi:hypothetical protein
MDKPKVVSGKTAGNVHVWNRLDKMYFQYEWKNFILDADKTHWLSGRLEGKSLFCHQSRQMHMEITHSWETLATYKAAPHKHFQSTQDGKWDLERMLTLRFEVRH